MNLPLVLDISQVTGLIVLYAILGFGPGFTIGVIIGSRLAAFDKPLLLEKHEKNITAAGEHNAQWHPEHERWRK